MEEEVEDESPEISEAADDSFEGILIIKPIDDDFGYKKDRDNGVYPSWCTDNKKKLLFDCSERIKVLLESSTASKAPRDSMVRLMTDVLTMSPPDVESPLGEDGSTISTPLTYEMLDTLYSFMLKVVTGVRPFIRTEAYNPADTEKANAIEGYYDVLYNSPVLDFKAVADKVLKMGLSHGTVFLTNGWSRRVEKVRIQTKLTPHNFHLFNYRSPLPPEQMVLGTRLVGDGKLPDAYIGQAIDAVVEVLVNDNPTIDVISYFDFFMYPARLGSVEDATLKGYRFYQTLGEIKCGALSGVYDPDMVDILIDQKPSSYDLSASDLNFEDSDHDAASDEDDIVRDESTEKGDDIVLELARLSYRFDGDNDGYAEEWMFVIELASGIILSANRSNTRPGVSWIEPFAPFPRIGSIYGMPIAQLLEGPQEEMDTSVRMAMDAGTLAMTFIAAMSKGTKDNLPMGRISPGVNIVESDNPERDVAVKPFAVDLNPNIIPNIDIIRNLAERTTAASEAMSGVASTEGKTATEINQVLSSGSRRIESIINRFWRSFIKVHQLLHESMVRRNMMYEVNGEDDMVPYPIKSAMYQDIPSDTKVGDWLANIQFIGHGEPITSNEALKLQAAEKIMISSTQSPFMSQTMARKYFAERFFLQAYGIRNVTDFIGTYQEALQKDIEAQQQQGPQLPPIPPNANENYIATFIAMNPELGQQILQVIQAINQSEDSNSVEQDMMNFEKEKAKALHEIDMGKMELKHESDKMNAASKVEDYRRANEDEMRRQSVESDVLKLKKASGK